LQVKERVLGIKENIKAVKEEISTEEQFLEGMIKSERFFKRNKIFIIGLLASVVVATVSYGAYGVWKQERLKSSNEAYAMLLTDATNENALRILKEKNGTLYELLMFQTAVAKGDVESLKQLSIQSKNPIITDLISYQLGQTQEGALPKSELFSGMVLLQEGYALLKENKVADAKVKFAQIEVNSPLKQIAQNLEHYQGSKP